MGVNQHLKIAPKCWQTPFYVYFLYFSTFSSFSICDRKRCLNDEKDDFEQQLFAHQNTQHVGTELKNELIERSTMCNNT